MISIFWKFLLIFNLILTFLRYVIYSSILLDARFILLALKKGECNINNLLDEEWISLITEAKRLGLTIEEIREFLQREINKEEFKKAE
ncbi:hypothetical protein CIL03_06680 [Virgibacillus indicus]|uniref:Sin domain-containing protein n=1 Tax=Virgibacillus indicus TaxID=2024554 RepID=A0A265NDM1_9BACI|nr:hypothetical protein CIL03_06680 [Virgibacillus indicus]